MSSDPGCPPRPCPVTVVARALLWLFLAINIGTLFGIFAFVAFGAQRFTLHASLTAFLLLSTAPWTICLGKLASRRLGALGVRVSLHPSSREEVSTHATVSNLA